MSKEKILKKFRKKTALKDDVKSITIEEYNEIMLYTETLLEKALAQTREETIRDILKITNQNLRDYIIVKQVEDFLKQSLIQLRK